MILLFSDALYILERYASPSGPMGLRWLMLTLSGPVELFLLCFNTTWTCVVESVMLVVCSLSVFLSMYLFILSVLCLTVLENCLLNAFAICVGEVIVFSLKVMVLFLCCVVFCWLVRVLSSNEYVCCVCDPSVGLGVPSICRFVCLNEGCDFRV